MFNMLKRGWGVWWVCAAAGAVLAAGCVAAGSEEPGGSARPGGGSGVNGSVVGAASSASSSSSSSSSSSVVDSSPLLLGGGATTTGVEEEATATTATTAVTVEGSVYVGGEGFGEGVMGEEEYNERVERFLKFSRPDYYGEYSDERIAASAFHERAFDRWSLSGDIVLNDRSTPVGAFCWIVMQGSFVLLLHMSLDRISLAALDNLDVWHLEREAAERGIELSWETGRFDYSSSLRRFVLEAVSPEVRDVVFAPGLPAVLRPVAEDLYDVFEELLALPVRRVRPTVEELSAYPGFEGITEEEVNRIWLEEFEIDLGDDIDTRSRYIAPFEELFGETLFVFGEKLFGEEVVGYGEEVREVYSSECRLRSEEDWDELVCPGWVDEVISC